MKRTRQRQQDITGFVLFKGLMLMSFFVGSRAFTKGVWQRNTKPIQRLFASTTTAITGGWTVQQAWETGMQSLQEANVAEPEASLPHLLAAALDLDWETGYRQVHFLKSDSLTKSQAHKFQTLLGRRLEHEPLQYILGQWDFLVYTVKIRPPLLCPRPETEELVCMIRDNNPNRRIPLNILDVGCGTGVIGVALAHKLPTSKVHAIDIEPTAIETSLENAQTILGELHQDRYKAQLISVKDYKPTEPLDMVVSNPPYIPVQDYQVLSPDVLDYESESALCGGADGMDIIRIIIEKLPLWCKSGAVCWMEVDPTHPALLEQELHGNSLIDFVSAYKDMFGKDRFVKLQVR